VRTFLRGVTAANVVVVKIIEAAEIQPGLILTVFVLVILRIREAVFQGFEIAREGRELALHSAIRKTNLRCHLNQGLKRLAIHPDRKFPVADGSAVKQVSDIFWGGGRVNKQIALRGSQSDRDPSRRRDSGTLARIGHGRILPAGRVVTIGGRLDSAIGWRHFASREPLQRALRLERAPT
jgi:hypothetical protein